MVPPLPTNYSNAVGSAAEEAALNHFERLGYRVGRFGVEHIVGSNILPTFYEHNRSLHVNEELVRFLRAMPDLIIAREARDSPLYRPELLLVEVKYRRKVTLDNRRGEICTQAHDGLAASACGHSVALHLYGKGQVTCLGCKYHQVITFGSAEPGNVLFYLIADECTIRTDGGIEERPERIFVNLAHRPEWWFGDEPGLRGHVPTYSGRGTTFAAESEAVVAHFDAAITKLQRQRDVPHAS